MAQSRLLASRKFLPLFATQFLGAFNDNFFKNALIILVTFKAESVFGIPATQMVAAAGGVFILPFFLFSAQSGQLADKYEKTIIIKWVKGAEIAIMGLAAAGFIFHQFELLIAVLFLMGTHSAVFGPIKYSILPQHLAENDLVGGNALVEAGTFLAILLGTIAGGILVLVEPAGTTYVGAGLVVTAVLGFVACLGIPTAPPVAPDLRVRWNPLTPTWETIRFAQRTRSVFLSILGISWFWFVGGFLLSLFPAYVKEFLHADSSTVTIFLALFSIGIALGSLFCEKLSRRHLELGLVPLGSIGMSVFALDLYFIGAAPVERICVDLFLFAIFGGFYIVPLYTLVQTRSEKSHASRIIAANNVVNAIFMVAASAMLVLFLRWNLTAPEMFLALAILNAVVAIYIYTVVPEFLLRFFAWMLANVLYRLKITGADHIPKNGPAILICNHQSFVDWLVLAAGIGRPARFIMDHSFAKGPLMKFLVRQAKIIPIASAKVNPELKEEAFRRAAFELRDNELVCIFPEGRITSDGEIAPFRPGIDRMIRETPVPVIPMALSNLWGSIFSRKDGPALHKRPRRFWSRIVLRIGAPIPPENASLNRLQEEVMRLYNNH